MVGAVIGTTIPPSVPDEYDPKIFQQLLDYISELERAVYLRSQHVEIYAPGGSGGREPFLILRSPDGKRWKITVTNAGVIEATDIGDLGL